MDEWMDVTELFLVLNYTLGENTGYTGSFQAHIYQAFKLTLTCL